MDGSTQMERNPTVQHSPGTTQNSWLGLPGLCSPAAPDTRTPAASQNRWVLRSRARLPAPPVGLSPPGPPRPSAEPCSPLPPWLRHLRWHLAPRTARACHPRPATAWSPGIRLASPGTSRHGPSPAGPARAGATVAKRRKPTGRCREKTTSPNVPRADSPSTATLGCRKGWWERESLVQPPAPPPPPRVFRCYGTGLYSIAKVCLFPGGITPEFLLVLSRGLEKVLLRKRIWLSV